MARHSASSLSQTTATFGTTQTSLRLSLAALTPSIVSRSIVSGHTVSCTATGSQTNAGSSTKTLSEVVVKDGSSNDVSSNYDITKANGTLTVNKKSVAVTWGETTSFVYDGSNHIPTGSVTTGVSSETMALSIVTTKKDVGDYTATASCSSVTGGQAKCDNYTLTSTTKAFSITKADATCPTLTAYSGTYDASSHKITVSGGSGGTIQYRKTTTAEWSTSNPSRTSAGTTTVYVQVEGDSFRKPRCQGEPTW